MRVITNYAASPWTVCEPKVNGRVDLGGWNIASGVPANHVVSAYCLLVSGTGTIRFGWDSATRLTKRDV